MLDRSLRHARIDGRRCALLMLVACFVLAPTCIPPEGAPTRVLVYGDSLWAYSRNLAKCDLCDLFPEHIEITNYAVAATQVWPHPWCDGFDQGVRVTADPGCLFGADRALPVPNRDWIDTCGSYAGAVPTCIQDNEDHDVLLVQFGTNDVRSQDPEDSWFPDIAPYWIWLDRILAAKPAEMACVLVIPPPIWSEGFEAYNARLEIVAYIMDRSAQRYDCEVADLLGLYQEIEAEQGVGATLPMYEDCAEQGSPDGDCVHWSFPQPPEPAAEIVAAIDRAMEDPQP